MKCLIEIAYYLLESAFWTWTFPFRIGSFRLWINCLSFWIRNLGFWNWTLPFWLCSYGPIAKRSGPLSIEALICCCGAVVCLTGLRSRRISSDSSSDSSLKISTPTPAPTLLRLRPNKNNFIWKQQYAVGCSHILDCPSDCTQTGNTAIQHPFAKPRKQPAVAMPIPLNVVGMTVFKLIAIVTQLSLWPWNTLRP